jgi:hypothetical protein
MEAAIVFHFAGRGSGNSRLALIDFAQLLNPKWRAPQSQFLAEEKEDKRVNVLNRTLNSAYNFVLGGMFVTGGSHDLGGLPCGCEVSPGLSARRRCTPSIS